MTRDDGFSEGGSKFIHGAERSSEYIAPTPTPHADAIGDHLTQVLGVEPGVFHEIVSENIQLDILCFRPHGTRREWVLVTRGMSAHPMSLPAGIPEKDYAYAELVVALPAEWGDRFTRAASQVGANMPESIYWPVRALKSLARYPHDSGVFFAGGHTIPNLAGGPYDDSTRFEGCLLSHSLVLSDGQSQIEVSTGHSLTFLGVMFLYPDEIQAKLDLGLDEIGDKLAAVGVSELVNTNRKSAMHKRRKIFGLF